MNLIKIFLLIIFNIIIIAFMTQNSNEKVDIFFLNYSLTDSYLNVVLLFNLLFGVAAGFLASIFIIFGHKSHIKSLQNKNRILSDELNDLRNVAIDEGIYDAVEDEDY
ncbi:MAG: lipopolysaccharide assembly protein LapA domain-containing protein [Candidatus Neomarinimicrobiota bacterium]|mgnify:FL=1